MPGQPPDTSVKTGTGKVIPGHNHIFTDIAAQVIMTHIEATPGQDTDIIATTRGVACNTQVPHTGVTAINPTTTYHIDPTADNLCKEVPHHTTPEIEVDHVHIHPTKPHDEIHIGHAHTPIDQEANLITRGTPE